MVEFEGSAAAWQSVMEGLLLVRNGMRWVLGMSSTVRKHGLTRLRRRSDAPAAGLVGTLFAYDSLLRVSSRFRTPCPPEITSFCHSVKRWVKSSFEDLSEICSAFLEGRKLRPR